MDRNGIMKENEKLDKKRREKEKRERKKNYYRGVKTQ